MLHTARCNSSTAWNPPASVIDRTVTAIATHSMTTQSGAARKILSHEAGKTRISVACFLLNERGELNEEEEGQKEEVAPTEHMLERGGSHDDCRRVFFFARPRRAIVGVSTRSEEHTSELQSPDHLVCR